MFSTLHWDKMIMFLFLLQTHGFHTIRFVVAVAVVIIFFLIGVAYDCNMYGWDMFKGYIHIGLYSLICSLTWHSKIYDTNRSIDIFHFDVSTLHVLSLLVSFLSVGTEFITSWNSHFKFIETYGIIFSKEIFMVHERINI